MSEDQAKQPNSEQPESQTAEVSPHKSPTPQKSPTQQKSVVAKPGLWQQVLGFVRSLLPESVGQNFSNGLLTVAIASIVIILVIVFVSFPSGQPTTEVADVPIIEDTELPEVVDSKSSQIPELTSPGVPEPVELTTPQPPKLTPEQFLIVSIQNQISDITNQYGGGVIESLKVNFPSSLLIVEISDNWYDLNAEEQDKLANQMFEQAQDLDFSKLQVINSEGRMVARSPVIGSNMIILERAFLEIPG